MLKRHSSMTVRPPIMPFKWRPFDLYNGIQIDCLNVNCACAATSSTDCVLCRSNCDHLMLRNRIRKCRQSSRGSSSESSGTSHSINGHFNVEADSESSISTKSKTNSNKYYRKFGQRHSNYDQSNCADQEQCSDSDICLNTNAVNWYIGSYCGNITQNTRTTINNSKHLKSSSFSMPFANTEQIRKCAQSKNTPDKYRDPLNDAISTVVRLNDSPETNSRKHYNNIDINGQSPAESKYSIGIIRYD